MSDAYGTTSGQILRRTFLWGIGCAAAAVAVPRLIGTPGGTAVSAVAPAKPVPKPVPVAHLRPDDTPPPAFHTETYHADPGGQYVVTATVNGRPLKMVVDTGATLVSLSQTDARALGIDIGSLKFDQPVMTASGRSYNAAVTLYDVRLGGAVVGHVEAMVMAPGTTHSLLGMSFLRRLRGFEIRNGMLTIAYY